MKQNLATWDRASRLLLGIALLAGSFFAPYALELRVFAMALPAAYLFFSVFSGTCLGYRVLGLRTCAGPKGKT